MAKYYVVGYLNTNNLDQTTILLKEVGKLKTYVVETVHNFKIKMSTDMVIPVYNSTVDDTIVISDATFRTFIAKVITTVNDEDNVSKFSIAAVSADCVDILCRNYFGNVVDVKLKESKAKFGSL